MTQTPLVSIIILNWNGWRDTIACVESCRKLTWPNFFIVVVDNGSTDGSEDYLRQKLKDVEIIQSGANLGFAGGNNVGIRRALDRTEYVWLLNNDAVADPVALSRLVEAMEDRNDAGIAGSKIYYHDEPRKIWFAGGLWEKGKLRLRQRGANRIDRGEFEEVSETGSVSGCSMLVRSAVIRNIGLMEECYFLYWEDTEWCARAQAKGYKVLFVPGSRVWHKVSASAQQNSFSQYYYFTRNGFFFLREYDPLLMPLFAVYNLLFGLKCLASLNAQPLRGLARGFIDFVSGKKGQMRPGRDKITS
ncbi:MAG: glycosyltransferase family 2 protein [Nitrospiraceae bacterium]|nr:MAG: glycosyltransferase family 2 protein [Nitrospiraceae bacterium]